MLLNRPDAPTPMAGAPSPDSTAPPGVDGFLVILNWASWIGLALGVLGVIVVGAMMAVGSRRGEGGEHAARLGWVLAGCILIGAASGLVNGVV